ncbi:MFS general substrate transporter [Phanerochaete sordida]|uniref:MFS general substrate transporter n=1 Tax=Phanerochaete sordida TaxID=48140 RepID=A0A9P3L7X3_9APHY|nr:MFS general substrate transporter [Phanerochaete sordida]
MDGHDSKSSLPDKYDSSTTDTTLEASVPVPANSRVWLKIDLFVLPVVTIIFFLQFLDKGNIGNARVAGLQEELGMTNTQYSIALTVQYIPYILIELPTNLLLKRIGGDRLIPAMVVLWGIVTTLQGTVTSYSGLVACRFFLGLFEGGLLPGMSLYLSEFYPRLKLQFRISVFFAAASLAGAFSGLLAAAITKMEGVGGKHGWAWIFILEGLFTVCFGAVSFWLMPRTPQSATFLTAGEKQYISAVLREDGVAAESALDDEFSWQHVAETLKKPQVLILMIAGFFNGTTLAGLAYFTPSIVAGLGYAGNRAQLMSVPPFAVAFVLSLATSFLSDHFGRRGLTIALLAVLSTAGFALFLGSAHERVRYGSLFLALPGTYAAAPPLGAWPANNAAPHARRATALAALTTATNCGAVLSTWLLGALSPAPRYSAAGATLLAFQVGILACALANVAWLARANRRKREARAVLGLRSREVGRVGDESAWFEYTL